MVIVCFKNAKAKNKAISLHGFYQMWSFCACKIKHENQKDVSSKPYIYMLFSSLMQVQSWYTGGTWKCHAPFCGKENRGCVQRVLTLLLSVYIYNNNNVFCCVVFFPIRTHSPLHKKSKNTLRECWNLIYYIYIYSWQYLLTSGCIGKIMYNQLAMTVEKLLVRTQERNQSWKKKNTCIFFV